MSFMLLTMMNLITSWDTLKLYGTNVNGHG